MEVYLFDNKEHVLANGILSENETKESWQTMGSLITHAIEVKYQPELDECAYFGMADIDEPDLFWMYKVQGRKKSGRLIRLNGIHKFYDDLSKRGYIEDIRPKDKPIVVPLGKILEGTGWKIGKNSVLNTGTTNIYYLNKLEAFNKVIKAWNCEYRLRMSFAGKKIVHQEIDLAPQFAEDNGVCYEYGDKLVSVIAESGEDQLYTALCGRGRGEEILDESGKDVQGFGRKINFKDVVWSKQQGDPVDKPKGKEYVELPEATKVFGFSDGTPRLGLINFPDIEDPRELLSATYEALLRVSRPKLELKAQVCENEKRNLGEKVWVIRDDIGIRYQTRIFELRRSFLYGKRSEISFGDKLLLSRAEKMVIDQEAEAASHEETVSHINTIMNQLQTNLYNSDGYNYELKAGNPFGLPAGYYSFDKPIDENPGRVIYMGAGRLAISDQKTSDGQWIFRTFGTGEGFTADLIRSGTLLADFIKAGILSDVNGDNYWDMKTGSISIGGGALSYDRNDGFRVKVVDELKNEVQKKADSGNIISTINASREGISISGDRITLTGSTEVRGDFKVSGDALVGRINAQYIDVDNLNANNINRGVLGRGVDNGSCSLPERGSAYLSGSGTNFDTGSNRFRFIYDSGSYQNTFLVDGRITAEPISGQHMAFQAGGLYVEANGGYFKVGPGSYGVNVQTNGPCMFNNRIQCDGIMIGSATLSEADINKLHKL